METDLVGVGAGPANLSLGALLTSARERGLTSVTSTFLERNPAILWHSGQMFPGTLMQTEFYRDLVTPIDPTSRFSFLNYLKSNGRLDQFICSAVICPTRREFVPDFLFSTNVCSIDYNPERNVFVAEVEGATHPQTRHELKHIVLGRGKAPSSASSGASAGASGSSRTSDRTPGSPAPSRTPGAIGTGAAGSDAGQAPSGTSDRTPSK